MYLVRYTSDAAHSSVVQNGVDSPLDMLEMAEILILSDIANLSSLQKFVAEQLLDNLPFYEDVKASDLTWSLVAEKEGIWYLLDPNGYLMLVTPIGVFDGL